MEIKINLQFPSSLHTGELPEESPTLQAGWGGLERAQTSTMPDGEESMFSQPEGGLDPQEAEEGPSQAPQEPQ